MYIKEYSLVLNIVYDFLTTRNMPKTNMCSLCNRQCNPKTLKKLEIYTQILQFSALQISSRKEKITLIQPLLVNRIRHQICRTAHVVSSMLQIQNLEDFVQPVSERCLYLCQCFAEIIIDHADG